jgi:Zn-finger nucleic acid-binding protein
MRCPNCGTRLVEVDRAEVLIDACPECRGVWLDRGELDRILAKERTLSGGDPDTDFYAEMGGRQAPQAPQAPRPDPRHHERRPDDEHRGAKKRKRRSLLEDLFDFD